METTTAAFETDVIEASRSTPVLVDFWAPWCGPCRVLGPLLERLEAEAAGRWRLVKVNTEDDPTLASQFRISSIPAVKLFRDGAVAAEFVGALPEPQLRQWLDEHVPNAARKMLARAKDARREGRLPDAKQLLEGVLVEEPDQREARVELAELSFHDDRARALNLIEGLDGDFEFSERIDGLRTLDGLSDRLAQTDNQGAWPRYREGIQSFVDGDIGSALEAWIDVIRRDRKLDDDGARKACIAVFHLLGEEHELTREHRPTFASALF